MKINTDAISEKYRKYTIEVFLGNKYFYLLWGTNLENEDVDYLLVNESKSILAFLSIPDLVTYVNHANLLIDPLSTKKWANNYKGDRAYCTYDLLRIKKTLEKGYSLQEIEKEEAMSMVDFFNLFSDYAYQTENKFVIDQLEKKDTRLFCDYVYESFFWIKTGKEEEIKGMVEKINFENFRNEYLQLISLFEKSLAYQ
jgi:hypothetical protein